MTRNKGNLTVIYGTMFCGKTSELHRIKERYEIGDKVTQLFKPLIDNRYGSAEESITHKKSKVDAIPASGIEEISSLINKDADLYLFDELQFFPSELIPYVMSLVQEGKDVAVAGLPLDYRSETFFMRNLKEEQTTRSIFDLVNVADERIFLTAVCTFKFPSGETCGEDAPYAQRFVDKEMKMIVPYDQETIQVGAANIYAVRCPEHFQHYKETGLMIPKKY